MESTSENLKNSISDKLNDIKQIKEENITIYKLVELLGRSASHIIVIILCSPSALPTPAIPGITQIFALITIIIITQLLIGKKTIWLPEFFGKKQIKTRILIKIADYLLSLDKKINRIINKIFKFIQNKILFGKISLGEFNINNIIHPRLGLLYRKPFITLIYIFSIILAVFVATPIPFSNTAPSIAIVIIFFSLLEKDGFITILGLLAGIAGLIGLYGLYIYGTSQLLS